MYEETLTGRPHDTSVQKADIVTMKIWMQLTSGPGREWRVTDIAELLCILYVYRSVSY